MTQEKIAQLLINTSTDKAWYGNAVGKILAGISAEQAAARPIAEAHSIWEILLHMICWREYVLKNLSEDTPYEVKMNSEVDWPPVTDTSEQAWQEAVNKFHSFSQPIAEQIQLLSTEEMMNKVPGKKFSFYTLLHGIIQHDIYHAGQMVILQKMVS